MINKNKSTVIDIYLNSKKHHHLVSILQVNILEAGTLVSSMSSHLSYAAYTTIPPPWVKGTNLDIFRAFWVKGIQL